MPYHIDRFFAAVLALSGNGHIKQRLNRAFEENLAEVSDDELPPRVRKDFAEIRRQLHQAAPLTGESPISASVRKMSPVQASECAESIVTMYDQLLRSAENGQSVLPLVPEERAAVPPFLVKSV